MKYLYAIIAFLIFIIIVTYSYKNPFFISTNNTDSVIVTVINPELYSHVPYNFKINTKDTSDLFFATKNMNIIKLEQNKIYRVNFGSNNLSTLKIYKNDTNGILLFKRNYHIRKVPLEIYFFNKVSGSISVDKLNYSNLSAKVVNYNIDLQFQIIEFTLLYTIGDVTYEIKTKGNKLNKKQIKQLKGLKNRSPFIFKDIKVKIENDTISDFLPRVFYITK